MVTPHFGKVRRNSFKCFKCKREWSVRKDSVLENLKIPFIKFVLAIKLFELEVSVLKAIKELNLSYNTTHKVFMLIRKYIYKNTSEDDILAGEVEMDESYFGGKRKGKRGSLIYTDKFKSYDGLVFYGFRHERIDHSKRFANGKVYINGIEGFWSYAKGKLYLIEFWRLLRVE